MFSHAPEVPLGPAFASSLEKLKPILGGVVAFPIDEVGRAVSAPPPGAGELRHLGALLEATLQHAELHLLYRKPHAAAAERRTVHPLRLVPHEQLWTLIAYDVDRRALRHFVLTRIVDLARTGQRFRPPPGIDVDAHVRGLMGRFGATEEHDVRLALDDHAAFYARERPWHAGQTLTPRPDGRHELTLRVNNIVDVQTQILRWSGHVEVLAPDALRARVAESLRAAAERYEK
jgi:predicted DNA-binding transcriptional regulator YafY